MATAWQALNRCRRPSLANEVKAAIAAAAPLQRRAGVVGGGASEVKADAMVICSRWGVKVISDAHPVFDRPLVRAVRKQLQTIALLSLAHLTTSVLVYPSLYLSSYPTFGYILSPLAVNLQDARRCIRRK